jgi:glycyl-tRNA synthetase beta chain
MPADLIFEVGTEEIPAGFLAGALRDLTARAPALFREARLEVERLRVVGTPRRLTVLGYGVADRQHDVSEEVVGPPARVAFDGAGEPTKAAIGFAKRNGVELSELRRAEVEGKEGEYVVCTRREDGRPAREVLPGLLAQLVRDVPWPKSMRWADLEESFVRPVHWIVALLGGEVLPLELYGVRAGRHTRGHRFLAPEPVALGGDPDQYDEALREAFVIVDTELRRTMIAADLSRIEREQGAVVRRDDELLAEVASLIEYPVAICGQFDEAYLEVPDEVIVSAMRAHQRYFAVEGEGGALVNRFVTVAATVTRKPEAVRHGNERVLAARLADARFFFKEDQKRSLDDWASQLGGVVFQAKLGTIGAKVARVTELSRELAGEVGADPARAARAASLCKADLVTHMVGEFPDLQGVMGRHYAQRAGEPEDVARAIEEHYLPRGAGDALPQTALGAVVGLADRIDTLVGCFAAGLSPSGSADPYGLRRAALGVLAILLDRGWPLSLRELVERAARRLEGTVAIAPTLADEVVAFLHTRLRGLLLEAAELPADCVDAALAVGFDDVPDARARAQAVARLRQRADFEPLGLAFKRVANILKGGGAVGKVEPERFAEEGEAGLWQAFCEIEGRALAHLEGGDYHRALGVLAELKAPVDRFFDSVLVMDEDQAVRQNRLALLGRINATFTRIADFRQLSL